MVAFGLIVLRLESSHLVGWLVRSGSGPRRRVSRDKILEGAEVKRDWPVAGGVSLASIQSRSAKQTTNITTIGELPNGKAKEGRTEDE